MRKFEIKAISGEIADVDTEQRTVKAVWAAFGNIDRDSDIILPGAFTKTITENGPQGTNEIWALANHCAEFKAALGKPSEIYEDGSRLVTVTKIQDTEMGEDILKLYLAGCINQHSIGFSTIKSDWQDQTQKVRLIKEVKLYEGGPVLWGANPNTPMLEMSKSFTFLQEQKNDLATKLDRLLIAFKHGNFKDETFSLLEIEIKQIQTKIIEISTQAEKSLEPLVDEKVLEALRKTNLSLQKLI